MRCSISYCLHSIASLNSIVTVLHTLMHTCRQRDTDTFQYIKTDGGSEKRSTYCNSHCVLWDLYAVAGQKTNVLIIYCLSYILLFPLFVCWFSSPYTHTHKHVQTDSIAVKTNESFATLCMFVQYLMLLNDINIKASVWSETFPFCSPSLSLPPQPARHTHTLWLYFVTFCVWESLLQCYQASASVLNQCVFVCPISAVSQCGDESHTS